MSELRMDILGELPLEIAEMIFEYLKPEDLINCFSVSNRWRQQVSHDRVWSRHMPYHKYVKKYWEDTVGGSYDEGEGCQLMNMYITESRIKNNMKQGNYNVINRVGTRFVEMDPNETLNGREIWLTDGGFLLSNGDLLRFKDPPNTDLKEDKMTISSDLRLLALSHKNLLYIYERKPPTVKFKLLSLLAAPSATEEEPDGSTMLSVVSCTKLNKKSIASFKSKYKSRDSLECVLFTGVARPTERRVCLAVNHKHSYGLWDLDGKKLVHRWRLNPQCKVIEGWDRRGVCIRYATEEGDNERIEFYDVDMRSLTVIPLTGYYVQDLNVSYNFSVAIIKGNGKEQLVMWEKDSTEYQVLVDKFRGRIVSVGPSTIAYLHNKSTVAVIAAPHWQVVAHVKIVSFLDFHLIEFSDGSLFMIKPDEVGYIWRDLDRRNTKEISEWPIDCEDKFKLPNCSSILSNKGLKLVTVKESVSGHVFKVIDYNK